MKTSILLACVIAGFLALVATVRAHEAPRGWSYAQECCSDRDCGPYPAADVQAIEGGNYRLRSTGEFIGREKIKQSQDEEYHLCRFPTQPGGHIFCLYVPPLGS